MRHGKLRTALLIFRGVVVAWFVLALVVSIVRGSLAGALVSAVPVLVMGLQLWVSLVQRRDPSLAS